jgi:elongation factor G
MMGSAFKNKGVQPLLDGVVNYLPTPSQVKNMAIEVLEDKTEGETVEMVSDSALPMACYAFKLEESRFGQLTYVRVYQGTLKRGDTIKNNTTGERLRVQRLVRMHSNEMQELQQANAGEIAALFGVECDSGTTFTDPTLSLTCASMHVPDPVISLAITTKDKSVSAGFSKALKRFQREDPTFRVHQDEESGEIIISGMGELHLEIYVERMRREYNLDVSTGQPQVAFRETIQNAVKFDHLLKKQTGGSGMYARVIGRLEPMELDESNGAASSYEFVSELVGANIPPNYLPAIEKGFVEGIKKGPLTGSLCKGVRMILSDGDSHTVDSNEMAFRRAAAEAFRGAMMMPEAQATVMEPIMKGEVTVPSEYQGPVTQNLTKRKGLVMDTVTEGMYVVIHVEIPLNNMFGYSQELRSMTQGKGEFSMEYLTHRLVTRDVLEQLKAKYQKDRSEGKKD